MIPKPFTRETIYMSNFLQQNLHHWYLKRKTVLHQKPFTPHKLYTIFFPEREPVRQCNFHTVVIGGFVAHTGPFQLKWWLCSLYRPKMVLLVIVTPKYVGFGYYAGDMPHKFINQKPKKLEDNPKKNKKNKETKKPIPWRKPLGTTFLPRLCFFCFFGFFGVLQVCFVVFLSPVADESFRV